MSTNRCADLMAVGIANKLDEIWISENPFLLMTYMNQYFPNLFRWYVLFYDATFKYHDSFRKENIKLLALTAISVCWSDVEFSLSLSRWEASPSPGNYYRFRVILECWFPLRNSLPSGPLWFCLWVRRDCKLSRILTRREGYERTKRGWGSADQNRMTFFSPPVPSLFSRENYIVMSALFAGVLRSS